MASRALAERVADPKGGARGPFFGMKPQWITQCVRACGLLGLQHDGITAVVVVVVVVWVVA